MKIESVIWDCDGVLVDSEIIAMRIAGEIIYDELSALNSAHVQNISREEFAAQIVVDYAGKHFSDMLVPHDITNIEEHKRLDAIKMEQTIEGLEHVETFKDLYSGLFALKKDNVKLAVATSSELSRVIPPLAKHDLRQMFVDAQGVEHIYSAQDSLPTPRSKPKPDVYIHAMNKIKANPETTVAVEDSKSGVLSARAAGLNVIGFTGGSHIPLTQKAGHAQMLQEHGAFKVASSMRDVFQIITRTDMRLEPSFKPIAKNATKAPKPIMK